MPRVATALKELAASASRLGGLATETLGDRLELLALELREDRVRILQLLLLALAGATLVLCGLVLLAAAGILALPPEWRVAGLVVAAAAALAMGLGALCALKRRLKGPGLFAQSVAELKKDKACF
ncbi:MAG: phage holin family protein [Humidesulfovibrio sp.]|uniref:phage holin family protein n=1 Tax=Humidesulfovibrio sp. TaxID=2910988 RepID=UPI0027F15C8C|nr:phage holin family protein [Humidesulfovibrio sp.]MDQ7834381.1 phage holin family protein [Humidesulfovibrio sp.]